MTPARMMTPRGCWRDLLPWERRDVTVCIAAACLEKDDNEERRLVLCSDRKMGGALGSAETGLKMRVIWKDWRCLTSGTDTEIYALLLLLKKHFKSASIIDETNVVHLIRAALNERKRDKASELIQGKYAIAYDEFLATGKDRLPPDLFRSAVSEIEMIDLGADLIVIGYVGRFPWMLQSSSRGDVKVREDFATIGEGAYLAQASLLHREHSDVNSLARTLYNVYEAKKFAEGVPSVGKRTIQSVFYPDGRNVMTSVKGDNLMEAQYEKFGRKKIDADFDVDADFFYKEK